MTAAELASLAMPIYGPRWISPLAREMGVAVRTAQRWATDGIERPATADSVRRFLDERRRTVVNPPPADGYANRDDDAYDEFRPRIEALVAAAERAGWHPAEALTAILAVTIDLMRRGADDAATIETLQSAIAGIRQGNN